MAYIKQKRDTRGRYGRKTWRHRLNKGLKEHTFILLVFCFGIMFLNYSDIKNLPSNTLTIYGSTARLESVYIPDTRHAAQQVTEDDDKRVTPLGIEEAIREAFPENPEVAVAIMMAESHGKSVVSKPNKDGTRDVGIFQINDVHGYSTEDRLDPIKNIRMARAVFEKQGWAAWSAWKNKSYQKYL